MVQEKRISGTNKVTMMLIIQNVEESDYGTYKCYASNQMGKADGAVRLFGKFLRH